MSSKASPASNSLDVDAVRAQFPALAVHDGGQPRIYLDNPAGTQVPRTVADRVREALLESNANLGGPFPTSVAAGRLVDEARGAMADLLNAASPREIVFGQNMTSLTFHLARSIGRQLQPGDEVLLSRMEHDANITPWVMMARDHGLEVRWLEFDTERCEFDPLRFSDAFTARTRLACIGYASNVLGTVNDVASFCTAARAHGAMSFIDAVHQAPHGLIDVQALGCDFLACSAYKFFGPHQGILWGRLTVLEALEPYRLRPAPAVPPGSFETGTQSHEGLAGVSAAVDYLASLPALSQTPESHDGDRRRRIEQGMELIAAHEAALASRLVEGLEQLPGLRVHGITHPQCMERRAPTISFTLAGVHPDALCTRLARAGIFTWSGHSYALEPLRALGLLESGGVLRAGIAHYNTESEIDRLLDVVAGMAAPAQRGVQT